MECDFSGEDQWRINGGRLGGRKSESFFPPHYHSRRFFYRHRPSEKAIQRANEGVSILKPLKGVDKALEANLESFFWIQYPKFEILFSVDSEEDPAAQVVKRLIKKYPLVEAHLVICELAPLFSLAPPSTWLANLGLTCFPLFSPMDAPLPTLPQLKSRMLQTPRSTICLPRIERPNMR